MNESIIYQKLTDFFSPQHLEIINESHKHQGHSGSPNTGNSHFSVVIKSKKLNNVSKLVGQRMIYSVLSEEMKKNIHALSIKIID
jgi:BolA protein